MANNPPAGDASAAPVLYRSISAKGAPAKPPPSAKIDRAPADAPTASKPEPKPKPKPKAVAVAVERKPVPRPHVSETDGRVRGEVEALRRRYRATGFRCEAAQPPAEGTVLEFALPIDDPDFPFDIRSLKLRVALPPAYPHADFARIEVLSTDIPDAIRARIRNRMAEASERMPRGESAVRALLRVLERNLERWMVALPTITAAPSSTIKIIPASAIVVSPAPAPAPAPEASASASNSASANAVAEAVLKSIELHSVGVPIKKEMAERSRFHPPEFVRVEPVSAQAAAGAVQIDLRQVRMRNISLIVPVRLGVSFVCARCRATTHVADLRSGVDRIVVCSGCKQHFEASYVREAVHENCHKLGYLRTKRTSPTDLLPIALQATCAACMPSDPLASTVRVEGVRAGEPVEFACRHCHEQCSLLFEAVGWTAIPALLAKGGEGVKSAKLPTKPGEPLPAFGTCHHYSKSCRWFRFPCCGRAYPCDDCHNADAANKDHVVEWATRQVCGFCSREFSTAQKYCECGETPGIAAKNTAYWEGGKGLRDQSTMSRKDRKKYRNLEKTVSNKAKGLAK